MELKLAGSRFDLWRFKLEQISNTQIEAKLCVDVNDEECIPRVTKGFAAIDSSFVRKLTFVEFLRCPKKVSQSSCVSGRDEISDYILTDFSPSRTANNHARGVLKFA